LPQALGLWSGGVGVSGVGLPLGRTLEIKISLGQPRRPLTWIKLYLWLITCDQRHSRGRPQIATSKHSDMGMFMTRLTLQEYFEQSIRARLQNLAVSQASDRELIEGLRAIATDYKRFLFNDNSP
jgi:hypothetical protein